jgi:hypothetical protein
MSCDKTTVSKNDCQVRDTYPVQEERANAMIKSGRMTSGSVATFNISLSRDGVELLGRASSKLTGKGVAARAATGLRAAPQRGQIRTARAYISGRLSRDFSYGSCSEYRQD